MARDYPEPSYVRIEAKAAMLNIPCDRSTL